MPAPPLILQANGQQFSVALTPHPDGSYAGVIDGQAVTFRAERLLDGGWLLTLDDSRLTGYTAAQGHERWVYVGGQHFTFAVTDARASRRRQPSSAGDLTAQMPGKVIAVRVREGETVERGHTLVVLEAMKMEIRVSAPGDGRVQRVLVRVGDVVERGQRLLEMA